MFKVVWAAWKAPRGLHGASEAERAGDSGSLSDPLLTNGHNGGLYGGTSQYGMEPPGGMGRRTQSLQWLDKAAEVRVAGEPPLPPVAGRLSPCLRDR